MVQVKSTNWQPQISFLYAKRILSHLFSENFWSWCHVYTCFSQCVRYHLFLKLGKLKKNLHHPSVTLQKPFSQSHFRVSPLNEPSNIFLNLLDINLKHEIAEINVQLSYLASLKHKWGQLLGRTRVVTSFKKLKKSDFRAPLHMRDHEPTPKAIYLYHSCLSVF